MNIFRFLFGKKNRNKSSKSLDYKINLVLEDEEKVYLELNSPPKEIYTGIDNS